jgi:hypothetical protein
MQEKLARAITNNERCNEYCEKRMSYFEVKGKCGANLESYYKNLNSIPPISVEPEGFFSKCGRTVTKIRSSLHVDSVENN